MMFVLAVLIYRLRPAGWWLAVVSMTIGAASYLFTLARHDLAEIYAAMQTPPEQIELMRNSPLSGSRFTLIFSLLGYIVCMGYALYVRRYFSKASVDAFKASTR